MSRRSDKRNRRAKKAKKARNTRRKTTNATRSYGDDITCVRSDDPDMQAASEEARRRWPEFLEVFRKRRPWQKFSVKAAFGDSRSEYMWVLVADVDDHVVIGALMNQPTSVEELNCGDLVTVKTDDVRDWEYSDAGKIVGGFTQRVLKRLARGRRDR